MCPSLPFCPACGGKEQRPFRPPALESRKKVFTADGGHRVALPEETLARHGYHVSAITGAVAMLERITLPGMPAGVPAADGVLHVYVAGHNMARPHHDLAELRGDLRNMSAGKGTSDVQARASGLREGLVGALAAPATTEDLAARLGSLPAEAVGSVVALLLRAGLLHEVAAAGSCAEDEDPALQTWAFHDLLFHARSRQGRSDTPYGGTDRLAGRLLPTLALKPVPDDEAHEWCWPSRPRAWRRPSRRASGSSPRGRPSSCCCCGSSRSGRT
jgi:hypothetical protein